MLPICGALLYEQKSFERNERLLTIHKAGMLAIFSNFWAVLRQTYSQALEYRVDLFRLAHSFREI